MKKRQKLFSILFILFSIFVLSPLAEGSEECSSVDALVFQNSSLKINEFVIWPGKGVQGQWFLTVKIFAENAVNTAS